MTPPATKRPSGDSDGIDALLACRRMAARWDQLDQLTGRTGARLAAEATMLGLEALHRVGINATARACGLTIYSRPAFDLVQTRAAPTLEWTDHKCARELSPHQVLRQLLAPNLPPRGHSLWVEGRNHTTKRPFEVTKHRVVFNPLHTVIEHESFIADLGLGAFARDEIAVTSTVWRRGSDIRPFRFVKDLRWVAEGEPTEPVVVLDPGPRIAVPRRPHGGQIPAEAAELVTLIDALVAAIRSDGTDSSATAPTEDER
jgi:hypothetical protein